MSVNRLVDRRIYREGDKVIATLGQVEFRGTIRGVGTRGAILEIWIIDVCDEDRDLLPKQYPYSCILVPHTHVRPLDEGA